MFSKAKAAGDVNRQSSFDFSCVIHLYQLKARPPHVERVILRQIDNQSFRPRACKKA